MRSGNYSPVSTGDDLAVAQIGDVLATYLEHSICQNPNLFSENDYHISLQTLLTLSRVSKSWNSKFSSNLIWLEIANRLCESNTDVGRQLLAGTLKTNQGDIKKYVMRSLKISFQEKRFAIYIAAHPPIIVSPNDTYCGPDQQQSVLVGTGFSSILGGFGGCIANCYIGSQNLPLIVALLKGTGLALAGSIAGMGTGAAVTFGTCAVIQCTKNRQSNNHNQTLNELEANIATLKSSEQDNPFKVTADTKQQIHFICVSKITLFKANPPKIMTMADDPRPETNDVSTDFSNNNN